MGRESSGDPAVSVGNEVAPHGARINLGAYGGTDEASKTPANAPQVQNEAAIVLLNTAQLRGSLVGSQPTIAMATIYYGTNSTVTNTDSYVSVYPPARTGEVFSVTLEGLDYDTTNIKLGTSIVQTKATIAPPSTGSRRGKRPPLMPGLSSSPVTTSQ